MPARPTGRGRFQSQVEISATKTKLKSEINTIKKFYLATKFHFSVRIRFTSVTFKLYKKIFFHVQQLEVS